MDYLLRRIGAILKTVRSASILQSTRAQNVLYKSCGYKSGNDLPLVDDTWRTFLPADRWGGEEDCHAWFYVRLVLDESLEGREVEICVFPDDTSGNEMQGQYIVYIDGRMECGLDMFHTAVTIPYRAGTEIYFYAYTGMTFSGDMHFVCTIRCVEPETHALAMDLAVPYDILGYLDETDKYYSDIRKYLNHAVNLLDLRVPGSPGFYASVRAAREYLTSEFYEEYCTEQNMTTVCVGHTHIDVAWLWTLGQTREKVQRTFSTVLMLMRRYPDFIFMSSQALLYEFFRQEAPKELYEELRQRIREGRWEVEGSMWVEADCNLISGESMVRQILFGKRFFQREFEVNNHILWLPDVFGYSASMPQILQKSGIDVFLTSKISWNDTDTMPHDTFLWRGIDGTEIFTYFLTAQDKVRGRTPSNYTTYCGMPEPRQIRGTWDRYQDKVLSDEVLLTFGYGDGGGGPTAEHIETIRRLTGGIQGCANTRIDTATHFFDRLTQKALTDRNLTRWVGELYLEFHRGTYTTMARNKRNNRKAEFLLQNIEWLASLCALQTGMPYPAEQIDALWQSVLVNQFHDIIPGSSIGPVYEDSDRQYAELFREANELFEGLKVELVSHVGTDGGYIVFNPHSFSASSAVWLGERCTYVENVPPKGYKIVRLPKQEAAVALSPYQLENEHMRIRFNDRYEIISVYDKTSDREYLLPERTANRLMVFEDINDEFDAWELRPGYRERCWVLDDVSDVTPLQEGARAGFRVTRRFMDSTVTQTIVLYADTDRLDFETEIDWQNHNLLLKAEFPVDINTDRAVYNIQFGNLERSTHRNTSWDSAKFEVCAHRFADVSETGCGVALLNDCKYGYDIEGGQMRLSLLRSPTDPNPQADIGAHVFTYSLYPHRDNFYYSNVVQQACLLNNPLFAQPIIGQSGTLPDVYSLVSCDADNVLIETIKKSQDGALVLRVYESLNRRTRACLRFGFPVARVLRSDLMENPQEELPLSGEGLTLEMKPYEIQTILVYADI